MTERHPRYSKAKGTRRETAILRDLQGRQLDAERTSANTKSCDIWLHVRGHRFAVEVKDRQRLDVQETLRNTKDAHPERTPVVIWHKTKAGDKIQVPVGPDVAIMYADTLYDLLIELDYAIEDVVGDQLGYLLPRIMEAVDVWVSSDQIAEPEWIDELRTLVES